MVAAISGRQLQGIRFRRLACAVQLWGFLLASSGDARAQPGSSLQVEWQAPPSCPQLADVQAALWAHIPSSNAGQGSRMAGVVECDASQTCRLELRLSGRVTGERELLALGCAGLADTAAVLAALALDGADAPRDPPAPAPPEPQVPPEAAGDLAAASWELELLPRVLLNAGTLPTAQLGGGLAVRWGRGLWKLSASAGAFGANSLALDDAPARLRFTAWDVALEATLEWPLGPLRFGPSAGVGATGLLGRSRGVAAPATQARWMLAPRAGVGASLRLGSRWSLRGDAQALLLRPRTRWSANGFAREHTVSSVVGRFALGVSIRL